MRFCRLKGKITTSIKDILERSEQIKWLFIRYATSNFAILIGMLTNILNHFKINGVENHHRSIIHREAVAMHQCNYLLDSLNDYSQDWKNVLMNS